MDKTCDATKLGHRCIKFAGHPGRCRFARVYRERLDAAPTPRRFSQVTLTDGRTGVVVGYDTDEPNALVKIDMPGGTERPIVHVAFADIVR